MRAHQGWRWMKNLAPSCGSEDATDRGGTVRMSAQRGLMRTAEREAWEE